MGIDVCMVSYKTPEMMRRFFQTLEEFPADDQDVFVRVNEPSEIDSEIVRGTKFKAWSGSNIGYAKAVNDLVARGKNELIGIFNADVAFTPGALQGIVEAMEQHPEWDVVGPRQVNSRGRVTHAGIFGTNINPKHRGWMAHDPSRYSDTKEAVTVSGSAYFIRRDTWNEMTKCPLYVKACEKLRGSAAQGAFLPTDHFYEETFCSYHVREHGGHVVYYGGQELIHEWSASPITHAKSVALMKKSQSEFRLACDMHDIERD